MEKSSMGTAVLTLLIGLLGGYFFGLQHSAPVAVSTLESVMDMSMQGMMHSMTSDMEGKTGDALDKAFLEGMIVHHQGAVEMAQLLLKGTQRPELKKLGADIISAQTGEIEMMKQWQKQWFTN